MWRGEFTWAPVTAFLMGLLVLTQHAVAQSPAPLVPPAQKPGESREPIIGGQLPPPPNFQQCIEVEIGGDRAFGCLNQQLKRQVERVNPSLNLPPLDARSSDVRVGNVNEAAIRQQYGPNYGRSVIPFRPPSAALAIPAHR
jgi:hypothetical protein